MIYLSCALVLLSHVPFPIPQILIVKIRMCLINNNSHIMHNHGHVVRTHFNSYALHNNRQKLRYLEREREKLANFYNYNVRLLLGHIRCWTQQFRVEMSVPSTERTFDRRIQLKTFSIVRELLESSSREMGQEYPHYEFRETFAAISIPVSLLLHRTSSRNASISLFILPSESHCCV